MIAYVCKHIWEQQAPVLLVIHEEDGCQILCDELHEGTTPIVMHLTDFFEVHPDLSGIQFLKPDHLMERVDVNSSWIIEYNG